MEEWSREEEEKLLHLAKILPNQWRTIGPLVGRTSHQCLAHYEKLLDLAQQKDEEYDPADDPRRLRPGEIDPNPESKAARPDPIDMDEDEKEMLQEARARLANTKGKKAKRKARERQLEEARRIASLQKRRELKAAGINVGTGNGPPKKKKKKGGSVIDYRREVPFFQEAPAGFFAAEESRDYDPKNFKPIALSALEGKRKFEIEAEERKKDAKKQKLRKEQNLPAAIMETNKLNDPNSARRAAPLSLPAPQMTEEELEELAKLRKVDGHLDEEETVTSTLLSDYKQTPTPMHAGANGPIRTPARVNTIMMEAQNLIALSTGSTPLAGGVNTPLHKTDFAGATPARSALPTPNVLATPLRTPRASGVGPGATPVRDQLQINTMAGGQIQIHGERYRKAAAAKQLDALFSSLPKPKNKYDLVLPEEPEEDEEAATGILEDQADIEERKKQAAEVERQRLFRQRSSALQRNLPRVTILPKPPVAQESPESLIQAEFRAIVLHDHAHFPHKAIEKAAASQVLPPFEEISEELLLQARQLVEEEVQSEWESAGNTKEEVIDAFVTHWQSIHDCSVFVPSQNRFALSDSLQKDELLASLSSQFDMIRGKVTKEASRAKKLESKVALYHAGYEANSQKLHQELGQLYLDAELAETELNCFRPLQNKESFSIKRRIAELTLLVDEEKQKETELQARYAAYSQWMKSRTD